MAISDTEKLDFLWKKVIFGVSKTAGPATKFGSNETVSSPLPAYAGNIWTQSDTTNIPVTPPSSDTSVIKVYYGASRIHMTNDPTSPANLSWLAGQSNLIPVTFGSSYNVRVFLGDPQTTGVRIFPDTTGNEFVFDYNSGVLNFTGGIPAGVTNGVYIQVYQYIGTTLADTVESIGESSKTSVVANIAARDALTPNTGDMVHVLDAGGDPANAGDGEFADYLWTGSAWVCIATQASARTDALTQGIDIISDNFGDPSELIGTVGNGTRVVEISIEVTTSFDNGADMTIGFTGDEARLLDTDGVDLQTVGTYVVYPVYQFTEDNNVDVLAYYTGTPAQGAARITITWA